MIRVLPIFIFLISGCSSIDVCQSRTYKVTLPETIPFIDGEFSFERSNEHVDCELDPEDRRFHETSSN